MKAGNITPGVRNHSAGFPDPATLGQSPHASRTCRASSVDVHGVIRSLRCVPRVPCKLHLRLAAAPAWLDGSGSTDQARRLGLDGSSSTAALQHAQEAVEPKAISISSKAALQRTWGGYSEAIDGIAGSTPARSRRLRAPDSAQRRAPRKSCIAPPECPPLFDARRLARKARPARQASL